MFTPINAENGVPNPYKNHSLAELGCRRGYKSPMIGKPVLAQTHVPSWWRKESTSYDPPKSKLKLSWAYGYRGHDARQNCFYNAKGEVVYTPPRSVVYNPIYETQKHITDDPESDDVAEGNTDDILCMARHPDKSTFATGEIGRKPNCGWSSDDQRRFLSCRASTATRWWRCASRRAGGTWRASGRTWTTPSPSTTGRRRSCSPPTRGTRGRFWASTGTPIRGRS